MTKRKKVTNSDLHNNTQTTKDWATRTSSKNPGYTQVRLTKNAGTPDEKAVPAPLLALYALLLNDTTIMWYGSGVEHQYT
jgi:hypothetical protein